MSRQAVACGLVFDWDGVWIRSELPKAAGWTLAALSMLGKVPEMLICRLRSENHSQRLAAVSDAFDLLNAGHNEALHKVTALAGLSRENTKKEVWRLLMADYTGRQDEGDLQKLRNEIKDALIIERSEIIPGTRQLSDAAWGRLPMALVTQTTTKDVIDQAKSLGIQLERFKHIECAGDELYRQITLDKKAVAYTIACRQLDVQPSHAIAFEDSDSGIKSAATAGLDCVALREPHNRQQLKLARIVVPDLRVLASPEVLTLLETPSAQTPIERLCSHFKPR